ncbi:MAG TPA: VCBS repeat-containing protein, partial [Terriglobales bacterium]
NSDNTWTKHDIDHTWSQAHAVVLVDFRNSGNLGLLTGKRYMAENGDDPGEREPLGVYWYERLLTPGTHELEWARHVIHYGGRVGGGVQIAVKDIDGDGDLDFVVAGKSGLFLFENKLAGSHE